VATVSAHRSVRPGLRDAPPATMSADEAPRPSVTFEAMRLVWFVGYKAKGAGVANQIMLDPPGVAATERAMREAGDRVGDAPRGPVDSGERELDMIAESFDAAWGTGARRNVRDCEVFGEQVQAVMADFRRVEEAHTTALDRVRSALTAIGASDIRTVGSP
jgi:hypothetical protein